MLEEQIKKILSDIFDLSADQVDESVSLQKTPSWDSMRHLEIMSTIESEFGITLEVADIIEMKSFLKILEVLKKKGF